MYNPVKISEFLHRKKELVKIDPRSIGVGQYQHDVNVTKLNRSLTEVVESCVNRVGVNINTATLDELDTLPGIGPTAAQAILDYRLQHGPFQVIQEIQNVPGIGPATFTDIQNYISVGP